ncbi:hypothetical protein B484DRAFT_460165 [Ochromonadaceae sp. CCMP2298]|nr:hypothetical protein B484DRAFT_460165 [Ochromonadaceae sp. CCMP2298]
MSPTHAALSMNSMLSCFIQKVNGIVQFNFAQYTGAIKEMSERLKKGDEEIKKDVICIIARTILSAQDAAFMTTSSLRQSGEDDRRRRNIRKRIDRVFIRLQTELKLRFTKEVQPKEGDHSHVLTLVPRKRTLDFDEEVGKSIHTLINKHRKVGPEKVARMRQLFYDAATLLTNQLDQFEEEVELDRSTGTPASAASGASDSAASGTTDSGEDSQVSEGGGLGIDAE